MKKIVTVIFLLKVIEGAGQAQDVDAKNILHSLDTARQDTDRVMHMVSLANHYKYYLPDSSLFYGYKASALARKLKFPEGEVKALFYIYLTQMTLGNESKALEITLRGLKIAERNNLRKDKAQFVCALAHIYGGIKNYPKALTLFREAKALCDSVHDSIQSALQQNYIGETYMMLNQPDSALYYCQSAYENAAQFKIGWLMHSVLLNLGRIQQKKGNTDLALAHFRQTLSIPSEPIFLFHSYFSIARLYQQINKPDSCVYYAKKSLETVQVRGFYLNIVDASMLLSGIYEKRSPQKALKYSKMAISYKDSIHNLGKTTSFENLNALDEQERRYEIETNMNAYRNRVKQYILIGSLSVFLLVAFILHRIYKIGMRHEIVLQKQKTAELEMQALRAQMNPHFIFNSLNSINLFILENNKLQASEYLSAFSRLVRLILNNSQESFIPLERELDALQLYLELESLRFEQRFDYKISVDDNVDTTLLKVPPLIIQPYAENAIWHGLMHKKDRGHLEIELFQQEKILFCKISDDGIGRSKAAEFKNNHTSAPQSVGMRITADRIAILQDKNQNNTHITVTDLVLPDGSPGGTEVLLRIPVLL